MNYFTADIHLCDECTLRSDNRPFKTIKAYDNFIIKDWNKTAKEGDTIYVVGDLLDCNNHESTEWLKGLQLIKKVKADIVLVLGNNEERVISWFFDGSFANFEKTCKAYGITKVCKSCDVEIVGTKFHLTHQIKDGKKRCLNLFGHTHLCSGLYHPNGLCVSTDLNHFRLFTEEILAGYLERKIDYWDADENTNYVNPFLKEKNGKVVNIKSENEAYKNYLKVNTFENLKGVK